MSGRARSGLTGVRVGAKTRPVGRRETNACLKGWVPEPEAEAQQRALGGGGELQTTTGSWLWLPRGDHGALTSTLDQQRPPKRWLDH